MILTTTVCASGGAKACLGRVERMGKEELEKVNTDNSFKEFHCKGKRREK